MTPEQKKRMEENRVSNNNLNKRLAERKAKQLAEAEQRARQPGNRIRDSYREDADRKNPNPAAQIMDSRGRPKERSDHHKWLGQP